MSSSHKSLNQSVNLVYPVLKKFNINQGSVNIANTALYQFRYQMSHINRFFFSFLSLNLPAAGRK